MTKTQIAILIVVFSLVFYRGFELWGEKLHPEVQEDEIWEETVEFSNEDGSVYKQVRKYRVLETHPWKDRITYLYDRDTFQCSYDAWNFNCRKVN